MAARRGVLQPRVPQRASQRAHYPSPTYSQHRYQTLAQTFFLPILPHYLKHAVCLLSLTSTPFATQPATDFTHQLTKQQLQQPPPCLRRSLPAPPRARPPRRLAARRRRVSYSRAHINPISDNHQTPTRPSVVSLLICSSPTSSARRSARTIPASSSVSLHRLATFSCSALTTRR